jgi:hypothetical protein
MAQDYVVSVSAAFKSCQTHFSGKCRAHGVASVEFEVDAFVLTSESWTVAVRRGDEARNRHCVVRHIDTHVVWHRMVGVRVDEAAVPAFGIDVDFRLLFVFEELVHEFACFLHLYLVAHVAL